MNQQEVNELNNWADEMFGKGGNVYGRNDRYLTRKIDELEKRMSDNPSNSKDVQAELEKCRVEMGLTRSGAKKPRVDWNYVRSSDTFEEKGMVVKGLWQPGREEANYLKSKLSTGD